MLENTEGAIKNGQHWVQRQTKQNYNAMCFRHYYM